MRDLCDSLYRGSSSGGILAGGTDEQQPSRDLSVTQQSSPFSSYTPLLDGQQRLTSQSAVLRGEMVEVRVRKRLIDILFNLDHPPQRDSRGDRTPEFDVAELGTRLKNPPIRGICSPCRLILTSRISRAKSTFSL